MDFSNDIGLPEDSQDEKSYECPFCDEICSIQNELIDHLKAKHYSHEELYGKDTDAKESLPTSTDNAIVESKEDDALNLEELHGNTASSSNLTSDPRNEVDSFPPDFEWNDDLLGSTYMEDVDWDEIASFEESDCSEGFRQEDEGQSSMHWKNIKLFPTADQLFLEEDKTPTLELPLFLEDTETPKQEQHPRATLDWMSDTNSKPSSSIDPTAASQDKEFFSPYVSSIIEEYERKSRTPFSSSLLGKVRKKPPNNSKCQSSRKRKKADGADVTKRNYEFSPAVAEIMRNDQLSQQTEDPGPSQTVNEKLLSKTLDMYQVYCCSYCEKLYNSKSGLKHHYETHHPTEVFKSTDKKNQSHYFCTYCKIKFVTRNHLIAHLIAAHLNLENDDVVSSVLDAFKAFPCQYCCNSYTSLVDFRKHNLFRHPWGATSRKVKSRYCCPYCDATFVWKKKLISHFKSRHKVRKTQGNRYVSSLQKRTSKIEALRKLPYNNLLMEKKKEAPEDEEDAFYKRYDDSQEEYHPVYGKVVQWHENNVRIYHKANATPHRITGFLYKNGSAYRALIFCTLAAIVSKELEKGRLFKQKKLQCLEANSTVGAAGMQWSRGLGEHVIVSVNGVNGFSEEIIRKSLKENKISDVKVTVQDPNTLLLTGGYDFIYLEIFASKTYLYMDNLFRKVPHKGIVCVTATHDCSLNGKNPSASYVYFNAEIQETEYLRELCCRLFISVLARAAARCCKGIEVLCVLWKPICLTVIVRVKVGEKEASRSIKQICKVIHCRICGERGFLPEGFSDLQDANPYLRCTCQEEVRKKNSSILGPVWKGRIFSSSFLTRLMTQADLRNMNAAMSILEDLLTEARCPYVGDVGSEQEYPCFYHKMENTPKQMKLRIEALQNAGFRASHTHFCPGAIRTDASVSEYMELCELQSKASGKL